MEGSRAEREGREGSEQHTQQQSSYADLDQAVHENLKASGAYGKLLGRVRAEIFGLLRDEGNPPPTVPNLNFIVNELFKEYLVFNGYDNTLSVFAPESGQRETPAIKRTLLTRELGLRDDEIAQQVPLIYSVVEAMRRPNLADDTQNTETRNNHGESFARQNFDESSGEEQYDGDEDHFGSSAEFIEHVHNDNDSEEQDNSADADDNYLEPSTVEFST